MSNEASIGSDAINSETDPMLRLKGRHLYLRRLKLEDAPAVYEAIKASRRELDEFFVWSPLVRAIKDTEEFIKSRRRITAKNRELVFGIFSSSDSTYMGNIGLNPVPASPHSAEVGYWVSTSFTGRGVATASAALITIAAFEELGYHRLVLRAATDNVASNRVAKKLGMKLGGVQRHELQVTRGYLDLNYYTLLEEEYARVKETLRNLVI